MRLIDRLLSTIEIKVFNRKACHQQTKAHDEAIASCSSPTLSAQDSFDKKEKTRDSSDNNSNSLFKRYYTWSSASITNNRSKRRDISVTTKATTASSKVEQDNESHDLLFQCIETALYPINNTIAVVAPKNKRWSLKANKSNAAALNCSEEDTTGTLSLAPMTVTQQQQALNIGGVCLSVIPEIDSQIVS